MGELVENAVPIGTASLADIIIGIPNPTPEEVAAAIEENSRPVNIRAKEKLEQEMEKAKEKTFAEPIIEYLIKRCNEDNGLCEDVCQEHKTWEKCFEYIYEKARELAKGQRQCAVRDDVVYEWAEDYYHKDDIAEEEEKAKKEVERKQKEAEKKTNKTFEDTATRKYKEEKKAKLGNKSILTDAEKRLAREIGKACARPIESTEKKEKPKPIKKSNEIQGQLDIFSLLGT